MELNKKMLRILIVEDDPNSREAAHCLTKTAFCNFGFTVKIFLMKSVAEAMQFIGEAEERIDYAFVAIRCNSSDSQQKDGYGVVSCLKDVMPDCVSFVMTKLAVTEQIWDEITDCGAITYLEKPLGIKNLQANLESYINVVAG